MTEINKILANYLMQPNRDFPLDCETLDYAQKNDALLAVIGNIAGDKTILLGCELVNSGTTRNPGYVFLQTVDFPNGEILYFEGGAAASGLYLKKEIIAVNAQNIDYPQAYVRRSLAAGTGSEAYVWGDLTMLVTNTELAQKNVEQDAAIALLAPPPLGIVQMWAGTINSIPQNYLMCSGQELLISEYQSLYNVIGRLHTTSSPSTSFCLPDLRSRFIVGYNVGETDYNAIAKAGGEKKHILSTNEMPSHVHSVNDYYFMENKSTGVTGISGYDDMPTPTYWGTNSGDRDNDRLLYRTHNSASTGGGAAHENRPPYYTLAYIMRVR